MKRFVALAGAIALLVVVSTASAGKPASKSNWSVKPTKLSFGSVPVGSQSVLSVTVTNTSAVTEQVPGGWQGISGDFADFAVQGSSSCLFPTMPLNVPAGGSCNVDFAFRPPTAGSFKATIQVDLNPGPPVLITLTGRGT